jgi:hypothetical protein
MVLNTIKLAKPRMEAVIGIQGLEYRLSYLLQGLHFISMSCVLGMVQAAAAAAAAAASKD